MKKDIVYKLTENFEYFLHVTEESIEFWIARDLQHLLGYGKWDNFQNVISKAKTACEISGQNISDHFADVGKMVDIGSGAHACTDLQFVPITFYSSILLSMLRLNHNNILHSFSQA